MDVQKTRAQIRLLGPFTYEEFEKKTNEALSEMTDVFVVSTQTIMQEDGVWIVVTYKETS